VSLVKNPFLFWAGFSFAAAFTKHLGGRLESITSRFKFLVSLYFPLLLLFLESSIIAFCCDLFEHSD